jgi:hypothetical protein
MVLMAPTLHLCLVQLGGCEICGDQYFLLDRVAEPLSIFACYMQVMRFVKIGSLC